MYLFRNNQGENNFRIGNLQNGEKRGMTNTKMYTFLEQNIVAKTFPCLHKLTHGLTFRIVYFLGI